MSIEILTDTEKGYQCMFCNTTMWAFGGIFKEDEDVENFLEWLPNDARTYKGFKLENLINEWRNLKR